MVFFNYATMQMAAKIVYYGPGLCGKTTNLHHVYAKTSPQSRGEMVSLETETDRTLFFDLLPIDVGVIGGFKTRLQLYTVPGQVFYNTTRKLVLKGVDGIVFVADSQIPMLEANVESFVNLRENLAEIGTNIDEIPLVIQLNKRDLPNIHPVERIVAALDPEHRAEHVEAVAASGAGVFETLKAISKLTLRTLRRRMTGEQTPVQAAAPRAGSQFRVMDSRTMSGSTAVPQIENGPTAAELEAAIEEATATPAESPSTEPEPPAIEAAPEPAAEIEAEAPAEPAPEPFDTAANDTGSEPLPLAGQESAFSFAPEADDTPAAQAIEPEVEFGHAELAKSEPEPEVKTVKVRSSVDVMAELEALRKRATGTTTKVPKRDVLADLASLRPKRDMNRTLHLQLPSDLAAKARSVRVTLSFEDGEEGVIDTQMQQVELGDTSDVRTLSVNLKIDLA
jgi:signal recognition particle receptor subunit beta